MSFRIICWEPVGGKNSFLCAFLIMSSCKPSFAASLFKLWFLTTKTRFQNARIRMLVDSWTWLWMDWDCLLVCWVAFRGCWRLSYWDGCFLWLTTTKRLLTCWRWVNRWTVQNSCLRGAISRHTILIVSFPLIIASIRQVVLWSILWR